MAKEASPKPVSARDQAKRLAAALDAIEAQLDTLGHDANAETVVAALSEPVRAFDQAAKEA